MNLLFKLFLLLILTTVAHAQYEITNYNIKDGLSNYKVQSIYKDKQGYIWIGTQDGLNRFDGSNFKIYKNTPNDPNTISDGNILAITQDTEGLLWIAIDGGGINILNPLTDQITKLFDGKDFEDNRLKYTKNIHIDKEGVIWAATWGGLIRYNKKDSSYKVFKHTKENNSISNTDVKSSVEDQDGTIWIATSYGLSSLNKNTNQFTNYYKDDTKPSIPDNSIRYLFVDSNNLLWIGTKGVLTSYDKKTNEFNNYIIDPNNPRANTINKVYEDSKHRLWICTEEGIYISDQKDKTKDKIRFLNTEITLQDSNSIFEDETGLIWFGTRNEGLNIINTNQSKIQSLFYKSEHPISRQTLAITAGINHSIWFGSFGNGIINYNTKTKQYANYLSNSKVAKSRVQAIHHDSQNRIWMGTYWNGLYVYDYTNDILQAVPTKNVINCIYEHTDQTVWVGGAEGIQFFDLNQNEITQNKYKIPNEILNDFIFFIKKDSKNNIWIATMHHGVYKISHGITIYKKYDYNIKAKDRYSFISFYEDTEGIYYLGTRNGGLVKIYPDGKITNTSTQNGLSSNTICGIVKDNNNNLWLSTAKGINLVLNTTPKTYRSFDKSDGVDSFEFYRSSVYQNEEGTIFFGGTEGISYFSPEEIIQDKNNKKTIINGLNVLNTTYKTDTIIDFKKQILLNYKENHLTFQFSSIGFYQSNKYKYKYQLVGLDKHWINTSKEKSVSYTNLKPGKYIFKALSTNQHGVWNTEPAQLHLTIRPPFWLTWWFYLLLFILTIGSLIVIIKIRERKIIIEKESAQFKLQALRSQMNPHFIFNSLNSIQYFIVKNENRFALNYLSKFSKLVRKILVNSTEDRITLADEIAFLENYIDIESLRFDKEINYKIDLSKEITNKTIEIPSMLIQPYVENAIIHGLMNLKKEQQAKGQINISFKQEFDYLKCTITDNGVGREASKKINSKLKKRHKSLGLSITQSRLNTLNKTNKSEITVTTEDLLLDTEVISGTKISIFIPLD